MTSIEGGTLGQPVDGKHGKLTLNADGTYTYTLNAGVDVPKGGTATENFTYTIMDKDGDTSEATLTITIKGDANEPVVTVDTPEGSDASITVDEGKQPEHGGEGHAQSGSGSFTVQLNGEDGVITVGGENGWTVTVTGDSAKVTGSTVTVNGVAVTVTGATQAADGTWTVNYEYELTGPQTHGPDGSATDASLTGEIAISVTDATGDTDSGKLTVEVHDDVPTISASGTTSLVPGGGAGNLADGQAENFTQGGGGQSLGHSSALAGWSGVTMYAAKVTYSGSGNDVQISNIDGDDNYTLKYSPYKGNPEFTSSDWGLTVDAGNYDEYGNYDSDANHNEEISVIKDAHGNANQSEAVVFDLGGQLAYGVTIDFGAFYNGKPGAEGTTQWDHVSEKALVTFYRDGEIVGSTIVEGNSSTGTFTLNSSDVVLGGFDKVVISAVDNRTDEYWDEHSDFTIQGIDFITKRDDPFIVSEGKVTAESGADGFADAYADSHVQFDLAGMVNEDSLSEDGTSGTITVLVDGQPTDVTLTLREGASGDSILTGTLPGGEQLFTATLDKDGNWTMEQYDQFRIPGEEGQESSNKFDLVFKTEDADGDIRSTTVNVPLEVVDQTINADNEAVSNGNDTIVITGGDGVAGTVAAGDSGGVDVITNVQPGQDYNISIMLDLSGSMADPLESGAVKTRIEMAVDALKKFFETSLQNHDGDICLQLVGFGTGEIGTRTWSFDSDSAASAYTEFVAQLEAWQDAMDSRDYSQGTNYEAAMKKATEWFTDASDKGGVAGNGNYSTQATVQATLEAAQGLQSAGGSVQVNAIGIGTSESLHEKAQTILDLIDNTGGSGQTQTEYPCQHQVQVGTGWLDRPIYEWQWTTGEWEESKPLILGDSDLVDSENDLTAALVGGSIITSTELADAGDDTVDASDSTSSAIIYGDVMNTDRLLYELKQNKAITQMVATSVIAALPDYGSGTQVFQWLEDNDDKLTGTKFEGWTHDDSVKYMLQHAEELGYETRVDADGDFYLVKADGTVLNMDGSEAGIDLDSLTGRDGGDDVITGSSASDTIYGQEGHDTIYGGGGHDGLYGGTGNDLLVGDARPESLTADTLEEIKTLGTGDALDAFIDSVEGTDADGNDQLFGGAGNDVLLGMGGDDYLDGGAGEDATFGGGGNDIIVYDKADYLVSGGSGIDFMVSTDSQLTMEALLGGTGDGNGPIVDGIEVLLKGKDALSLTSLDQLAKEYGITLDTNDEGNETLILDMDKWTYDKENGVYTSKEGDLTLETNLTPVETSDPASEAVQQQVFTLEHSNG